MMVDISMRFAFYVTDKLPADVAGGIRIKLLPFGAVEDFRGSVSKVLSKTEDYLESATLAKN